MSSGIKTGRIKVDDQVEKPRFSKEKTGFTVTTLIKEHGTSMTGQMEQ